MSVYDSLTTGLNEAIANEKGTMPLRSNTKVNCVSVNDLYSMLYRHRSLMFSVICSLCPDRAWKSKKSKKGFCPPIIFGKE